MKTFKHIKTGEIASVLPKDGTPCLVSDSLFPNYLRYANGKGEFYNDGRKSGNTCSWRTWRILDMDNLPVND